MAKLCKNFQNVPLGAYRPLVCKPLVVTTRDIGGHGLENRQRLFFLTKPNTIREHATLDLLFPHPPWLTQAVTPDSQFVRKTSEDETRLTDMSLIRVGID